MAQQQQHQDQAPEPRQQSPERPQQQQEPPQQEPQQQSHQQQHSNTIEKRIAQVLRTRVDRILLVLENVTDNKNYLAILRTCDVLGVQRVWVIHSSAAATTPSPADAQEQDAAAQRQKLAQGRKKGRIARASSTWLDVTHYSSTADAVGALRADGWTIWATDLSPGALSLADPAGLQLPQRLAVVVGTESSGISSEMRDAADRCVFLPMFGFTESLNVGVAAALVLQSLIAADPGMRGQLLGEGRAQQLADKWRAAAGRGAHQTWAGATVTHAEGRKAQSQQQPGQQQQSQLSSSLGALELQLDS